MDVNQVFPWTDGPHAGAEAPWEHGRLHRELLLATMSSALGAVRDNMELRKALSGKGSAVPPEKVALLDDLLVEIYERCRDFLAGCP
jgi:hypothetical protein